MSHEASEAETPRAASEQIRDARDLLTRLYREIGISAVAAALEVRKERPVPARPAVAVLQTPATQGDHTRAA